MDPVRSHGQGYKFQCIPKAPDRRGDQALSGPTSLWPTGGQEGNEDWAAGARRAGEAESV